MEKTETTDRVRLVDATIAEAEAKTAFFNLLHDLEKTMDQFPEDGAAEYRAKAKMKMASLYNDLADAIYKYKSI